MEETKKTSGKISDEVICVSNKHWSAYILPVFLLLIVGLFLLMGLFLHITKINGETISGIVFSLLSLKKIMENKSTKWILTKEGLIMKSGFLPWTKSNFEVPIENIYEAYYRFGFWAKILGFGHLTIRRTEGTTSQFIATKMTNFKQITAKINSEVRNLKKLAKQVQKISDGSSLSISDELLKLNELLEKSIISEDEFKAQKNRLLNSN